MKVVEVLGKEKAIEIFKETKNIEEDGGMMVLVCILTYFCYESCIFCLFKCMALIKLMITWFLKFVNRIIFRKVQHSQNWMCSCPGVKRYETCAVLGLTERAVSNCWNDWCYSMQNFAFFPSGEKREHLNT